MKDVQAIVSSMPIALQKSALQALDEITRPLTIRDLDHALCAYGLTRKQRRAIQFATRDLTLIALVKGGGQ